MRVGRTLNLKVFITVEFKDGLHLDIAFNCDQELRSFAGQLHMQVIWRAAQKLWLARIDWSMLSQYPITGCIWSVRWCPALETTTAFITWLIDTAFVGHSLELSAPQTISDVTASAVFCRAFDRPVTEEHSMDERCSEWYVRGCSNTWAM